MQKSSLFVATVFCPTPGYMNPRQLQHASLVTQLRKVSSIRAWRSSSCINFCRSAGLQITGHVTSGKKTPVENSRFQAFCLRGFSDKLQTSTLNFAESWSLHRRLRREAEVKSVKLPARCGSLHTLGKKHRTTKKIQTQFQKPVNISQCCTTLRCVSVPVPLSV